MSSNKHFKKILWGQSGLILKMLEENYAFTWILIKGVIQTWQPFQCDGMNTKFKQISVIIHWEIITQKKLSSAGQNTQQRHNANLKYGQEYCSIPIFMPTLKRSILISFISELVEIM